MQIIKGIKESILIERLQAGDKTAFELIFRFYYPGLLVFTSQIIKDKVQAEDILQEFFIRIWDRRYSLNKADSLKSYFFTSVKNRSLNFLKKQKTNSEVISKIKEQTEKSIFYEPDVFVVSELQEKIKDSLSKLPPRCNEVFVLNRLQGYTNDEISVKLGISKRTVETQISNALKILKTELKDYIGLLFLLELLSL